MGERVMPVGMVEHRRLMLFLLTLLGLALGFIGDAVAGEVDLRVSDLVAAVLMAPLLAVVGGRAVSGPAAEAFVVEGLLFWPVWGLLAWWWLRKGRTALLAALIVLWSAQGFFQPLHRLGLVMSA